MNDKIVKNNLETVKHQHSVRKNIYDVILALDKRAKDHDASKLESPEQEIFGEHVEELSKTEYGGEAYKQLLEKIKPALDNHYAKNRHHPEHWPNGIDDMTLVDLLEMICDWKASTARNKNGNIRKSIEVNAKRFNMSPQLVKIFENTVRELFKD